MCYDFKSYRWKITSVVENTVYYNTEYRSGDIVHGEARHIDSFFSLIEVQRHNESLL